MTARDLLQRRTTDESGNTIWQDTPLVEAIVSGGLAVLDGVHRLPLGKSTTTRKFVLFCLFVCFSFLCVCVCFFF